MSEVIEHGICNCGCGRPTKLAPRNRKALGWVKGQPLRYLVGHTSQGTSGPEVGRRQKWCGSCLSVKPKSEFARNARRSDGLQGFCKTCGSVKRRAWHEKNRERSNAITSNSRRKKHLGLTPDEYRWLGEKQGWVCAICGGKERTQHASGSRALAVDHCHKTGAIRGLLCNNCNRALGLFKDSPELLKAAHRYIATA